MNITSSLIKPITFNFFPFPQYFIVEKLVSSLSAMTWLVSNQPQENINPIIAISTPPPQRIKAVKK
ncbi:hypothetical protein C8R34_12256 [Nitrosomonas sp. Nm84]|uniref:hypothetical protein n=1 Tax=Nitrosomonas sp. Nm84 TaxID=200124 RepID=UPI000D99F853|nr:hypothetical protein [Nitrosomonas sp. Nm84]PXW85022.1 hypothetical protein C8R34_12256 [Nitrosomonas sp. Nm84]